LKVITLPQTGLEIEIQYEHAGRIRREIFCGRTQKELEKSVADRRRELEKEIVKESRK
jgi:hypothetical protein